MPLFTLLAPPRLELPSLIPRSVLFANPERTAPQISPDGKLLAFVKPTKDGILNVWIRPIGGEVERTVTRDKGSGVDSYTWSADAKRILFFQDRQGDEVQHLFSVELSNGAIRDLTPFQGVRAQNLITSKGKPREVLVGLNMRDKHVFDMYRVDLTTGALKLDTVNPGDVLSWNADSHLVLRACSAIDPVDASTSVRTRLKTGAPWKTIFKVPFEQSLQIAQQNGGTSVVGFDWSGRSLYVVSSKDADTSRLLRLDSANGRVKQIVTPSRGADIDVLPGHSGSDQFAVVADPDFRKIQAVGYDYQHLVWKIVDPAMAPDFDVLRKKREGVFEIVSKDAKDRNWIVAFRSDVEPTLFALYDRVEKSVTPLFEDSPELHRYTLAPMAAISIRTRDNAKVVAYLTLPVGVSDRGLPLVVLPHGGPWQRDSWGFDPAVQLLANRGYGVLQVNFRGSTGYGVKFLNSATGGWGIGVMQNDLTDAVHWAIAQGIADPAKVAIMGYSYGGYASLSGMAFTPELYACAVDLVGPSDVATLLNSIPDYWGPVKKRWVRRIGLDTAPADFSRRISPLYHTTEIRKPLLIGHGANDPRVKLEQSERMVDEIRKRGGDVTFVVYPDEGHGLSRTENSLDFFGRVEAFFGKHLGGRVEELVGVKGSTAEVK